MDFLYWKNSKKKLKSIKKSFRKHYELLLTLYFEINNYYRFKLFIQIKKNERSIL